MLLQERIYATNIDCFVIDLSRLHLTFVAFCLLSVICKLLHRPISAYDRIPDRFHIISMEFLSLSRRRSSSRNILAAKSEEKRMFSQASIVYASNMIMP